MSAARTLRGTLAGVLLGLLSGGCITPPAVQPVGSKSVDLLDFPPGSELASAHAENGELLRGVWLPADPDAPVVVHLQGLLSSVTQGCRTVVTITIDERELPANLGVLADLRDNGLASLMLDYRGVGASDGEADATQIRADARAAWVEAVRRAGDPSRVVLRGVSLGTLAVATLLEDGARPGAVVLLAPVRAETAAIHFARLNRGAFVAWLADLLLTDIVDVDLVEVVRQCDVPLLVIVPEEDVLLPGTERADLRRAVHAAGGHWFRREAGHDQLALRARSLLDLEREFHGLVFEDVPPLERRLDAIMPELDAELSAASPRRRGLGWDDVPLPWLGLIAARVWCDPPLLAPALAVTMTATRLAAVKRWRRWLPVERLADCGLDALVALCNFDDPAGPLDTDLLDTLVETAHLMHAWDGPRVARLCDSVLSDAPDPLLAFSIGLDGFRMLTPDGYLFQAARRGAAGWEGLDSEDQRRHLLRLLLKSAAIPDRVRSDGEGGWLVECWQEGVWAALPQASCRAAELATSGS